MTKITPFTPILIFLSLLFSGSQTKTMEEMSSDSLGPDLRNNRATSPLFKDRSLSELELFQEDGCNDLCVALQNQPQLPADSPRTPKNSPKPTFLTELPKEEQGTSPRSFRLSFKKALLRLNHKKHVPQVNNQESPKSYKDQE